MTARRASDPDGEDFTTMRNGNGNGAPPWVKGVGILIGTIGLPAFLLLWILGAFHAFMPSPVTAALTAHDEKTTKVQRLICKGIWKDNPAMAQECDR